MWLSDSVYLLLKHLRILHVVFLLFFTAGYLQSCICFCLGAVTLSFSPLCPFLFFSLVFLFCSACPSRASRLIGLCFRLNERSVEAGWWINSRICNKQSQLALPLMLSLRLVLFLPCSTPQEGEMRDELLCLLASSSLLSSMHVLLHCHQKHKTSIYVQELATPLRKFTTVCVSLCSACVI